jgi:hypothetical protein
MEISQLRNPYDYANPVKDPSLFAGRDNALAAIGYLLDQGGIDRSVNYMAVYGKRAAGKTSLFNMTELMAQQKGYVAVRVDLVMGDFSPPIFFAKMYIELIRAVAQVCDLKLPNGQDITPRLVQRIIRGQHLVDDSFPLGFPECLTGPAGEEAISDMALREDLEYLVKQADRPIALLIDEAQVIAGQEKILSVLRTVGMRLQGYVIIMAGTADLIPNINSEAYPKYILKKYSPIAARNDVRYVWSGRR